MFYWWKEGESVYVIRRGACVCSKEACVYLWCEGMDMVVTMRNACVCVQQGCIRLS